MTPQCTANPAVAAETIKAGGVVAYPTEAVWGLGCDPADAAAVARILELKGRPEDKGLILIAGDLAAIRRLIADPAELERARPSWPGPVTWVFTAGPHAPAPVCRPDGTVALRWTDHPLAAALCQAARTALVSTSANPAGQPPARSSEAVIDYFGAGVDCLLEGEVGQGAGPSTIRDARSGEVLRPPPPVG